MSPSPSSAATAAARSRRPRRRRPTTREIAASDRPLPLQVADPPDPLRVARRRTTRRGPRVRAAGAGRATGSSARCRRTRRTPPRAVRPGTSRATLYECPLERSAAARAARGPGLRCAGEARLPRDRAERRDRLRRSGRWRSAWRRRRRAPNGDWADGRAVPRPLLHRHRPLVGDRAARGGPPAVPRRLRGVGAQLRRVPGAHDVRDAGGGLGGEPAPAKARVRRRSTSRTRSILAAAAVAIAA